MLKPLSIASRPHTAEGREPPMHADERRRTSACIRVHRRFQTTALGAPQGACEPVVNLRQLFLPGPLTHASVELLGFSSRNAQRLPIPGGEMPGEKYNL